MPQSAVEDITQLNLLYFLITLKWLVATPWQGPPQSTKIQTRRGGGFNCHGRNVFCHARAVIGFVIGNRQVEFYTALSSSIYNLRLYEHFRVFVISPRFHRVHKTKMKRVSSQKMNWITSPSLMSLGRKIVVQKVFVKLNIPYCRRPNLIVICWIYFAIDLNSYQGEHVRHVLVTN